MFTGSIRSGLVYQRNYVFNESRIYDEQDKKNSGDAAKNIYVASAAGPLRPLREIRHSNQRIPN